MLTIAQAAKGLDVSAATLRNWLANGTMPGVNISGRMWIIRPEDSSKAPKLSPRGRRRWVHAGRDPSRTEASRLDEYRRLINDRPAGGTIDIVLDDNERKDTEKRRWAQAAEELGRGLTLLRSAPKMIVVQIAPAAKAAKAASSPAAPAGVP